MMNEEKLHLCLSVAKKAKEFIDSEDIRRLIDYVVEKNRD